MEKEKNKRLAISLIVLSIVVIMVGLLITNNVLAASCGRADTNLIECDSGAKGEDMVKHVVTLAIDIISIGIGILGTVGIGVCGIMYLTSNGDEAKATAAKKRLLDIVIGLACYAVLYAISKWLLPGGIFGS